MATGDGGFIGIPIAVALFSIPAAQPAVKVKPPAAVAVFVLVGVPWLGAPKGSWVCTRGAPFSNVRKTIDITFVPHY